MTPCNKTSTFYSIAISVFLHLTFHYYNSDFSLQISIDYNICDPFWQNESEVAESRTEIWASEVGIGSKNGRQLFSIFSILDISRFISQNVKPQPPPPSASYRAVKSAYRLSGLEQKRLASVVFIKLVWFAWAIIPSPASQFWYQRKERDVPCPITGLNFQISDVSRPQSQSQWPFQQVLL